MTSINRVVMQQTSRAWLEGLDLSSMDAAEISGKHGRRYSFKSYRTFRYPKHDICAGPFINARAKILEFDIILANQVWEHLDRPYAATCNILEMLRPNGYFWIAVPFFIPYHGAPVDNSRWSARGLKNLLIEAGFPEAHIRAEQWGNRAAALRNFETPWPPVHVPGSDDLENDPDFPICSWALARKVES